MPLGFRLLGASIPRSLLLLAPPLSIPPALPWSRAMPKRFHVKLKRSANRSRPVPSRGELFQYRSSGYGLPTGRPSLRGRTLRGRSCRKQRLAGLWGRAGSWRRLSLGLRSLLYRVGHHEDPLYFALRRVQNRPIQKWEQPWVTSWFLVLWLLLLSLLFLHPLSSWLSMRSEFKHQVCPGPSCLVFQLD